MLWGRPENSRTGHARLAGNTGGDDADVRARDVLIGLGAGHGGIEPFGGAGFSDVEGFALRQAFGNVEKHHVAEFFDCCEVGKGAADVAGADQGDLGSGHVEWILCRTLSDRRKG